jgi:16S rRNA (cytosine967-C5)-methyltransferase
VERLRADHPDHWPAILAANNQPPPLTLRVSGDRDAYLAELGEAGIGARPLDGVATAVRLGEFLPVHALPGFAEGRVSVQDGAAQLAAPLLGPRDGERVLDACSAPGGKLAHLLEWAPGARVVGVEKERGRLAKVQETLERTGRRPAALLRGDAARPEEWWDGTAFDRILLDAPCTGTGVIRRHPDIKHLRRPEDVAALAEQQRALLDGLWPLLRPGGTLVYATCSVLAAENGDQVAAFLERHPEAGASDLAGPWGHPVGPGRQILPGEEDMDGFFYARLTKETGA